ncbi:MAG: FliH/SctL family protein [Nevskia sp.]|jgi:flagellar assembly protein FliH|nr:FliH/SctL family protein [Nevskia sp.]MCK9383353.1 FliH/SctL family protein [Nevskia sp.]
MAGVIRTYLNTAEESVTLGRRRVIEPQLVSHLVAQPKAAAESMAMAAVAIGAVAPEMAGNSVNADEAEAERRAEARHRAYDEGFKHGQAEGRVSIEAEWAGKLHGLVSVVEALQGAREDVFRTMEDDIVALAFEAIVRILGPAPVTRLIVEQMVRELFASGDYQDPITVRVSSEDYELLVAEPAIVELEDRRAAIKLVEDARLKLGGCIIETARGALDARIETQLERLRSALLDARASKMSPD